MLLPTTSTTRQHFYQQHKNKLNTQFWLISTFTVKSNTIPIVLNARACLDSSCSQDIGSIWLHTQLFIDNKTKRGYRAYRWIKSLLSGYHAIVEYVIFYLEQKLGRPTQAYVKNDCTILSYTYLPVLPYPIVSNHILH